MKKLLLILLILLLITGCNNTPVNKTTRPDASSFPYVTGDEKPDINIMSPLPDDFDHVSSLFIIYPAQITDKYQNLSNWQSAIYEKYGIELYINYPDAFGNIWGTVEKYDRIIYLHRPGLLTGSKSLFTYASPEAAYDLSPYYLKYGWNEYVEPDFIELLNKDGGIYAVPSFTQKYSFPRYYNSEYLEALGMEVPTSIYEFHDFLRGVAKLKNESGFYPMYIREQRLARATSDIFRAFGAYVNTVSDSAVSFNPYTGAVEDAVFSPNFDKALEYFKNLQAEKLLFIAGQDGFDGTFTTKYDGEPNFQGGNKELATQYREVHGYRIKLESGEYGEVAFEYQKGYYLTGINTRKVCEVIYAPSFYIFPLGIENIAGVIELFNEVFTNTDYYADLRYGMEGVDYIIADDSVLPVSPLSGSFVGLKQLVPVNDFYASAKPESTVAIKDISADLLYETNPFNDINILITNADADYFGYSYPGYFGSLFNNDYSTADAIAQYKKEFYKSGKAALLKGINDRMGMVSSYDYSGD